MKIVHVEVESWAEAYLQSVLSEHQNIFLSESAQDAAGDSDAEAMTLFVNSRVDEAVLSRFPKLQLLVTRSTGFDHIDLAACTKKNITVCNVPTYGERTVAEYAFALLLNLSRKIYPAIKRVHEDGRFHTDGLKGFDLAEKTLGVIGTGRIGCHVIKIANGFDMNVIAYDPYPKSDLERTCSMKYVSLEELLATSDAITLHAPYMPATHHLLNSENMKKIKKGVVLVNTARGALVETAALVDALASGTLSGAALDVLEEEGYVGEERKLAQDKPEARDVVATVLADHQLMSLSNVYITPHNAFNTQEALERILEITAENIEAYISGTKKNAVLAS